MGNEIRQQQLSRRSFIKGAAALGAAGAFAGCTPQNTKDGDSEKGQKESRYVPDEIYSGICRCGCAGHCFLDVHVRDRQVTRVTARDLPDTRYNRVCCKGLAHVSRMYSSKRVRYPMRRIEGTERGTENFERISWDEATEEVATKLKKFAEETGAASNFVLLGNGNFGSVAMQAANRFKAVIGAGGINGSVDIETSWAFGTYLGYGGYGTQNEPADWKNAKTFVCWTADPCNSTPQNMHFILDAKEAGARYVVIDPFFNANAGKADWFIGVNPATDGALGLAATKYAIEQGWTDEEFVRMRTEAPLFVKEDGKFLRMKDVDPAAEDATALVVWDEATDTYASQSSATKPSLKSRFSVGGIEVSLVFDLIKKAVEPYTPEYASEITGVSADDIKELARLYGEEGPVTTFMMFGCDRYVDGHKNYWGPLLLAAVTGNMAKSGAGVGWTYSQGHGYVNAECGSAPVDTNGNPAQGASSLTLPLHAMSDILDSGTYLGNPCPVRSLTIFQRNLVATGGDHNDMTSWLKKLEYIVVFENTMNETALYADILLPSCHYFEYADFVGGGGSTPFFMIQDKCTEPLYESKDDYSSTKLIAEKMGYGDFYTVDADGFLDNLLTSNAFAAIGLDAKTLREQKTAKEFFVDNFVSFTEKFGTATGLFKMYNESPTPWYMSAGAVDYSKERLPMWEPARYADVNSEARKEYPYHVFGQHMRTRTHTQWWDDQYTQSFDPTPKAQLNPADAAKEGIADGDVIRLTSKTGTVVMKAFIHPGVRPGEIQVGRSFNSFEFIEGHFGNLSTSEMGQMTPNSPMNDVVVRIEKVEA